MVGVDELFLAEDESDAVELAAVVMAEDESDVEESRIELDESPVDVKASVDVCEVLEVLKVLGTLTVTVGICSMHLLQIVSARCSS